MAAVRTANYFKAFLDEEEDDCGKALENILINDWIYKELSEGKRPWGDILYEADPEAFKSSRKYDLVLDETSFEVPVYRLWSEDTKEFINEEPQDLKPQDLKPQEIRRWNDTPSDSGNDYNNEDDSEEDEYEEDYANFDWSNIWEKVEVRDYNEADERPYKTSFGYTHPGSGRYARGGGPSSEVTETAPVPVEIRASPVPPQPQPQPQPIELPPIPAGRATLMLRNLPRDTTVQQLREKLSLYGALKDVYLPKNMDRSSPYFGTLRGFSLVRFFKAEDAVKAFKALYGKMTLGRNMVSVEFAREDR